MMKKAFGAAVIVIGFVACVLFFVAGGKLDTSGTNLTDLRSVGGNSVAEAYYQQMGRHAMAYSVISYACGLGIMAISLGLGGMLLFGKDSSVMSWIPQTPGLETSPQQSVPPEDKL